MGVVVIALWSEMNGRCPTLFLLLIKGGNLPVVIASGSLSLSTRLLSLSHTLIIAVKKQHNLPAFFTHRRAAFFSFEPTTFHVIKSRPRRRQSVVKKRRT
jgi:hypothetical protein